MKLSTRPALTLLLGTALAATLSSCEYNWGPGLNTQYKTTFTSPPGWRSSDVDRDSINNQPVATTPIGTGSATAIRKGTVKEQIESAPAGKSAAQGQDASGQLTSPPDMKKTN